MTLSALIFIAPAFRAIGLLLWPDNERIQYLFTLSRIDTLAMGRILAIGIRSDARWTTSNWLPIFSILAVGSAFSLGWLDRTLPMCRILGYSLVGIASAVLVWWAANRRNSRHTSLLRPFALTGLGTICYGVYLLQCPCEVLLHKLHDRFDLAVSEDSIIWMHVKILASVFVGTASWFLLEKPILRLKSHFQLKTHPLDAEIGAEPTNSLPEIQDVVPSHSR